MMRRFCCIGVLLVASCGGRPPANEPKFDPGILGRWDVTVHAEETYPLWFEIADDGGVLRGRLQGRFGHALDLERLEADGKSITMEVDGTTYRGMLGDQGFDGTGEPKEGSTFHWVAVRAPELPARLPKQWGEPIELFNGKDLTGWVPRDSAHPNHWKAKDGVLVNEESGSDLVTEAKFGDFQLHAEVMVPEGSNSGIYLRGRYEVQVQDDHGKEPHARHMGGVYGQITPVENAALPAGEWQSFDITLVGRLVTVVLNGKTIIDKKEIPGITGGALDSSESEPGPIFLQGDHGKIYYRNLVLKPPT